MKRPDYTGPCPVERVLGIISGKWKPSVIFHLNEEGVLRFAELQKLIPEVTQRMLTQQLREMERDGLIQRTDHQEKPLRVDYRLTELGETLRPVFENLETWGGSHMEKVLHRREVWDGRESGSFPK
ncbi:MAG: helix-turn-helix domain-containing protein [Verrucomicrobiota bacterium]